MAYTIRNIQQALKNRGYDPGLIDGEFGRMTMRGVRAFQIQNPPLEVDGIPGPETVARIFKKKPSDIGDRLLGIPWLEMAIGKKGMHEKKDNEALRKFLTEDGSSIGDPAIVPWCGDFVETCIALTLPNEILPGNPYLARNWKKFGQHVEPTLGAIGSFWRTSKTQSINGHVAFIVGVGSGVFYILGGNQTNQISVTKIAQARLLDTRWPLTVKLPKKLFLPTMQGGKLSVNEA